jgi:hypothetical protein
MPLVGRIVNRPKRSGRCINQRAGHRGIVHGYGQKTLFLFQQATRAPGSVQRVTEEPSRVTFQIGRRRYAFEFFSIVTELNPMDAQVIPINPSSSRHGLECGQAFWNQFRLSSSLHYISDQIAGVRAR